MTPRLLRPLAIAQACRAAVPFLGALAIACGDDDRRSKPVPPPGPPDIVIQGLTSAGHGTFDRDALTCVPPGADARQTVVVEVGRRASNGIELLNWTFRPFDGCGNTPQCGLLALRASREGESSPAVTLAAPSASLPLAFADPALGPGQYTLTVELIDDQGRPFVLDGGVFSDSVEVLVDPSCAGEAGVTPPITDAGSDANGADGAAAEGGPGTDGGDASGPSLDGSSPGDARAPDAGSPGQDASAGPDAGLADAAGPLDAGGGARDAALDAPTGG